MGAQHPHDQPVTTLLFSFASETIFVSHAKHAVTSLPASAASAAGAAYLMQHSCTVCRTFTALAQSLSVLSFLFSLTFLHNFLYVLLVCLAPHIPFLPA